MSAFLSLLGWEPLDSRSRYFLDQNPRSILIFPHTSFYDFMLYIFYTQADPVLKKRCRVLINPYFTKKFQWFLQHFGSIESTRREEKHGGATKRICDELDKMDEFILLLSPKGSMENNHEWRSGFYHMARTLNCPVVPAGFDFERKRFVLNEPFNVQDISFEEACRIGKDRLRDIIPRNPEKSEYPLAYHDPGQVNIITPIRMICLFIVLFVIIIILAWWFCYARHVFNNPDSTMYQKLEENNKNFLSFYKNNAVSGKIGAT